MHPQSGLKGEAMEPIQLLDHHGVVRDDHELFSWADMSVEFAKTAYRYLVRARAFDEEARLLQRQGELALWPPASGQEGIQVGSALACAPSDMIIPSYREHAIADIRGHDLSELIPVFRATRHGGWDPRAHNFGLYTFVIAAHLPHAVGRAMAFDFDARRKARAERDAVVTYFGDGATSQGDANEAFVFAASAKAPIVFICQNNGWAISVPTAVQSPQPLVYRPAGFGIPALRIDGNDPLVSYAATRKALAHVRAGNGPYFIEAVTYRMGAHTTSDDPSRYRTKEEEDYWRRRCPISRMRTYLREYFNVGEDFFTEIDDQARELCEHIRSFTRANQPGQPATIFDHVYTTSHLQVERDRVRAGQMGGEV
ncbi:MAG: thiamine pyrophosphate-dependent enzyme [Bowdeniella nasicola]|nr:thiamine pyrophosphate-dependent enzyme [Bowdeniella nasicola]